MFLLGCLGAFAQQEFSFEEAVAPASCGRYSSVSISGDHYKMGLHSLEWKWKRSGESLHFKTPVPYLSKNPNPKETSVSSFVFWVYSSQVRDGVLTVSFLKDGAECCHFDFNLAFQGWRGAWVAFDRDMEGAPVEDMDEIVFTTDLPKGVLYFDGLIPSVFEDSRYHSPDFQLPSVNKGTDVHWLRLLEHWNTPSRLDVPASVPEDFAAQMERIRLRYVDLVSSGAAGLDRSDVENFLDSFDISYGPDGLVKGKPIFFTRYAETYYNLGDRGMSAVYKKNGQLLRDFNDMMFRIAVTWTREPEGDYKDYLANVYLILSSHLLDQGMACGSGMGTIHHLGYSVRGWYNSQVLMMPVLKDAGLLPQIQSAVEWYSGAREVWTAPAGPGMDIDAFNTYLLGRIAAVLLLPDDSYKFAYMKALTAWIDNGFEYAPGLSACFKPDGTVFHHARNYPAYAVGGFVGAVRSVWLFSGSDFAISRRGHETLKNAMLQMRFYCNVTDVPYSMAGRHPEGSFSLQNSLYALLALAGSPDGTREIDLDLASAYLRLEQKNTAYAKRFAAAGIEAEPSPQGCRSYGYNSSVSVRGGDWLVNIAGHSRYLWAAESYSSENLYGRYLTHGSMQYINGSPSRSGYVEQGWDWCHIPGTTAAEIPMEEMRANVLNVDRYSGYEEMLLSDEWFAGGVAYDDKAAYSMILHEHDKYNGSLRARKSFFVFGNRIVCVGSGLENHYGEYPLHTTLFQNSIDPLDGDTMEVIPCGELLRDRLGNAWIVGDGNETILVNSLQHSYYENDRGANEGWFETAYIDHGTDVSGGKYDYLFLVQPDSLQLADAVRECPYELLCSSDSLHLVRDRESGVCAAAVFSSSKVSEEIEYASPCVMMYDEYSIHFSNPDLALYSGPSDEWFDENGKRIERSVYSRTWLSNPCGVVKVEFHLKGERHLSYHSCELEKYEFVDGNTVIVALTSEARTETLLFEDER